MKNQTGEQPLSVYDRVILEVFQKHYRPGAERLDFQKDELVEACRKHRLTVRNVPDIIYTFRARRPLPQQILQTGWWCIEPAGKGSFVFRRLKNPPQFSLPFKDLAPVELLDAIPEVVRRLLREDEQALLTCVLYNRLVDIFTGLTCFHIQNHYRAFVEETGQVELDALYVGVAKSGTMAIIPIEAKSAGEHEHVGRVQLAHMALLVRQDFPNYAHRLLAIKQLGDGTIGIAEFSDRTDPDEVQILGLSRFRLVREAAPRNHCD